MSNKDSTEKGRTSKPASNAQTMTLQKAIDMGEYNPDYLATFSEWNTFSPHVQL